MRNHDWQQEYDQFRDEILRLQQDNARLRAVVAKVTRQTNQLMDNTDFYLLPGQVVRDAKAALEVSDAVGVLSTWRDGGTDGDDTYQGTVNAG